MNYKLDKSRKKFVLILSFKINIKFASYFHWTKTYFVNGGDFIQIWSESHIFWTFQNLLLISPLNIHVYNVQLSSQIYNLDLYWSGWNFEFVSFHSIIIYTIHNMSLCLEGALQNEKYNDLYIFTEIFQFWLRFNRVDLE